METFYARCAGLDVHKKTVVACRICERSDGKEQQETKTFGTTTSDLLALADWLSEWGCTHVAMESTGIYWRPIYNLLESSFKVLLVNASHVKHVPGRKTDVKDAEWIAQLMQHGLLRASIVPEPPQRDLRDLTRYRTKLVQERAREVNRIQKVLESANIKLSSVATDILGVSGRSMLEALISDREDPQTMAQLAKGRMREKIPQLEKALMGVVREHHRFLLANQLAHIDFLDEQIGSLSKEIEQRIQQMSQNDADRNDADRNDADRNDANQNDANQNDANQNDANQNDASGHVSGSEEPSTHSDDTSADALDTSKPLSFDQAVSLLDTIPGIDKLSAEAIVSELGTDMSRFPSADHAASWAGLSPGNNESGGKQRSGKTKKGNRVLRSVLVEAALGASKAKDTYLSSQYHRLSGMKGKKRANVAVAHSILVIAYHMLKRHQPYQELGANYFDERKKEATVYRLTKRIAKLGYVVNLEPAAV